MTPSVAPSAPGATATPSQATATPTLPVATPSQATATPTQAGATPSQATATPTQAGATPISAPGTPVLRWRELGPLGGPKFVHHFDAEIRQMIGFDSGYLANQRVVGNEGQWATRLWFSPDGHNWQPVASFDEDEDDVRSMATDGRTVVMLVETVDYQPAAWVTTDGLNWQVNENIAPSSEGDPPTARAVWHQPDGWHAVLLEAVYEGCDSPYGCFQAALWGSADGLAWQRLGAVDEGDPSGGATLADGTVMVQSDFLMASSDGGATWRRIRPPRNCFNPYTPTFLASAGAADHLVIYGGQRSVCIGDSSLELRRVELPTGSTLEPFRSTLADTRFGILASAVRDCHDSACPPTIEHFHSFDGVTWSALDRPTADLERASQLTFVDGPNGVIGLATVFSNGRQISAFELVEQAQ